MVKSHKLGFISSHLTAIVVNLLSLLSPNSFLQVVSLRQHARLVYLKLMMPAEYSVTGSRLLVLSTVGL